MPAALGATATEAASSVGLLSVVTAISVAIATILSFLFWYIANKPNVVARPKLQHGGLSVIVSNDGKIAAKSLRIISSDIELSRNSEQPETLNANLPAMYPGEFLEYFAGVGPRAKSLGRIEVEISYRRWLWLSWPKEKRLFQIDFDQYKGALIEVEQPSVLEGKMDELARSVSALVQWKVGRRDRLRLFRYRMRQYLRAAPRRIWTVFTRKVDDDQ